MRPAIYLATNNAHKVEELKALFQKENLPLSVMSAASLGGMPEVEETEDTFEGNARLKVEALADRVGEGNFALADDSGLEVDFLDGAPGIFSSRFAGEDASDVLNLAKLMILVDPVPLEDRGAQFTCSLVLMDHQRNSQVFSGACRGTVISEARGNNGFGYDPAFIPDGYDQTFGELGWEIKSKISHRATALFKLISWLKTNLRR